MNLPQYGRAEFTISFKELISDMDKFEDMKSNIHNAVDADMPYVKDTEITQNGVEMTVILRMTNKVDISQTECKNNPDETELIFEGYLEKSTVKQDFLQALGTAGIEYSKVEDKISIEDKDTLSDSYYDKMAEYEPDFGYDELHFREQGELPWERE